VKPIPLTGPQLAVLVLVASYLGVPASKSVVHGLGLPADDGAYLSQVITMGIEAAIIAAVPGLRDRAASLLHVRVPRERFGELAAVVMLALVAQFALFGFYALRAWSHGGDSALAEMTLDPARGVDTAFSGATLRHLAITCLLAPLVEETVFRGFLLEAWTRTRSVGIAMLFSSAVFAACHMSFMLPFFMALLLAAVYVRTGALRASILVHFSANVVLWYPLFGQFLIPLRKDAIGGWWFQLACLAVLPPFIVIYALAAARSGRRSPALEPLATVAP
jgi:membrane protease YdiL (CAAX protease family)